MHRQPGTRRLLRLARRITRSIRALFGGGDWRSSWNDTEGGVGVREPRRPLAPTLAGGAALELPREDSDDSP
jgi:hypothetical protein